MKKFLKCIVIFVVLLIIINQFLLHIANDFYFKNYEKVNLNYKTYLMSDSHGLALGDLTEDFDVYNFSEGSESYFDMCRKLKFLIRYSKIDKLLITVDDHTLSSYRESMNNIDRSAFFYEWSLKDSFNTSINSLLDKYLNRNFMLSNVKARDVIKSYFNSKLTNKYQAKKEWRFLTLNKQKENSLTRFNFQFKYEKSKLLNSSLQDIINLCRTNNIELIGVKFPLTKEYILTLENNNFGADKLFKSRNIKIFNFKNLYKNNDDYFLDQDHLNAKGSNEFVKVFSNKLQQI